jgi:hypothetical protein
VRPDQALARWKARRDHWKTALNAFSLYFEDRLTIQ